MLNHEEDEYLGAERKKRDSPTWTDVVAPDDDGDDEWGAIAAVDGQKGWLEREMAGFADRVGFSSHGQGKTSKTIIPANVAKTLENQLIACPLVKYIELCSTGMLKVMKQLRKR